MSRFVAASALTLALALSACQDPSGVGLELIGEEGGTPAVVLVAADSVTLDDEPDRTGGFGDGSFPSQAQERILVGALQDPTFGDASAEAYFDLGAVSTSEDFQEAALTSATLRLSRDRVYGDSTISLNLALYEIAEDWNPIGATADTSFAVGDRIDVYSASASDTLITLSLPSSWIDTYGDVLRSDSASTAFDGFQLRLGGRSLGGAVLGFATLQSALRLTTASDTVDYPIREVFTHIERSEPVFPLTNTLLRDGGSDVLALSFSLEDLETPALARAALRVDVTPDALTLGAAGVQLPERLHLFGRTDSDTRVFITAAELNEEGDGYVFDSSLLTEAAQDAALGMSPFARYEVAPSPNPVSLDVAPIVTTLESEGGAERRPRFSLTVLPEPN